MSSLFSEQTIGIFLYSKDCVELEQMGEKDKNLHVTPLSCGIIIYIGDKKLLFDFLYTFWSKGATPHSPRKNKKKTKQKSPVHSKTEYSDYEISQLPTFSLFYLIPITSELGCPT